MIKLYFNKDNGPADESIKSLIDLVGNIRQPELVHEMILAALKAGQEDLSRADLKLMNSTMKEMRFTGKVFGPYTKIRKVTVFGSARTRPDETAYKMAVEFGKKLVAAGFMVITGGGPGIMQAANEGAGPENSFGINIQLPFEQAPNPVVMGNPRLINYKYFFNRKVAFLKEADAIALFPGGFGTLDEAMETLTLLQTGKHNPMPLVLIDEPGGTYWTRWMHFFTDELLSQGYISESDFNIFERVDSADNAIDRITQFYRIYHSIRYVNSKLIIRLNSNIDAESIDRLNHDFADILVPEGSIRPSAALPEEADEHEIANLPRLVVDFNFKDYGKLIFLIKNINNC